MKRKKPLNFRILGIDPGTAIVGWAVLEENEAELVPKAFGHIATSPKKSDEERIFEIYQDLAKVIDKYKPEESAIEKLFFFKNEKTVMEVSQARGAIILTLKQKGVNVFSYTPLEIKQALTGYGRADKKQVQKMVRDILHLPEIPKPDDTADAIATAICHFNSRKIKFLKNPKNN